MKLLRILKTLVDVIQFQLKCTLPRVSETCHKLRQCLSRSLFQMRWNFFLVTSYQLLVTSYQSLVTSHQLLVTSYQLLVTSYQSLVTSYQSLVTSHQLLVTSYQSLVTIVSSQQLLVNQSVVASHRPTENQLLVRSHQLLVFDLKNLNSQRNYYISKKH